MLYRTATIHDIAGMHTVRMSVRENKLSNPQLVTTNDYEHYLTEKGKGWVAVKEDTIVGFAIIDVQVHNIWALFVHPQHEGAGIGTTLHDLMLEWYFSQYHHPLHLSTGTNTKAVVFYGNRGWQEGALLPNGEIIFTITKALWMATRDKGF